MTKVFQTISPVDNSIYLEREFASANEIETTLANACRAQSLWKKTSIRERADICKRSVQYFLNNVDGIAEELTWQMGRPIRYAPFEITRGFQERSQYMIDIAEEALSDIKIASTAGFHNFIRREPLGVVLVLAPWNYPYLTSVNAVIPAIMSGNTVILKIARQTPLCAERYAKAFEYAGLPEGVFQYLHLDHQQAAHVISDHRISYVTFTGSVAGGKAIKKAIGERFITAGLELGGKDPAFVRSDADLDYAIENLVDGAFFNSGQSCCGVERIYVHDTIFNSFLDGFVDLTKKYQLGNPLDPGTTLGPMVSGPAADFARAQLKRATKAGAKQLIDPAHFPNHQEGTPYLAPQVMVNVDHSMDIMTEESFAPVVGIMPVKNDEEAIRLINDSKYGLTASIWTKDMQNAIKICDQIETGTCFMNRCDYLDPGLAWTGVKNSGRGTALSKLGYHILTRPKSFHLKIVEQ